MALPVACVDVCVRNGVSAVDHHPVTHEQFGLAPDEVTLETSFEDDLGADSVDLVELVMAMEEEFELGMTQEDEVKAIKTVGDAVNYVAAKLNG